MTPGMAVRRAALALSLALAACGGDDDGSFSPSTSNVSGAYHATTFTAEAPGGASLDLLALGATVSVILSTDGTTSGHLSVPGQGENGGNLDEDLDGTWTLSGSTVTFSQTTGTLIQDATFTAEENCLTGSGPFNGFTILIILTKNT
jgi:hypothetical protein